MKVEIEGSLPSWIGQLSDDALRTRLGSNVHARGATYARERAVHALSLLEDGRVVRAVVRGSGPNNYLTVVSASQRGSTDPVAWSGHCSCPMQVNCKHVAAVLITTRQLLAGTEKAPTLTSWETELAAALRIEPRRDQALAVLGFQLDVVYPTPSRYAGATPVPARVRMRAVTPGKSGRWVRTGVSWRDLNSGYGSVQILPEHREVARHVLMTFRAGQPSYVSPYSDPQIDLDGIGPSAWRLLAAAQDAGIALVGARVRQQIRLVRGSAEVIVDVRQPTPSDDAILAPTVRLPDDGDLSPDGLALLGSPAHGLFVDAPDELLLAGFDRPLSAPAQRLLTQGSLLIPPPELPRFLSRYYPTLRQHVTIESGDGTIELPEIQPPRLALDVAFEPGHRAMLTWSYDYPAAGESVRVRLDRAAGDQARDVAAESALLDALAQLPDVPGRWVDPVGRPQLLPGVALSGIETALFGERTLPLLLEHDDVTVTITGSPVAYEETVVTPLITVSAHDSQEAQADWFDLSVVVSVGAQEVPLAALITALARDDEHLLLDSGTWFRLDRPELQQLRRLIEEAQSLQDREGAGLRLSAFQAGLWEELVELGVVEHQSERWTRQVGGLLGLGAVTPIDPPLRLKATLRPYQLEGYRWLSLLWDHQLGGILADDMGLGKTLQTLAMAARACERSTLGGAAGPLLIVAPTSVVATWASEAARFCPDLVVAVVTETERRSGVPLAGAAAGAHLVVTSYALLRIDEEAYRGQTWSGLVLDEAQFVKNHQAKTYQCARRLPAPFKLAITGTPLENSLMDLWSMLSITAPGLFPSPQRFTELYRKPIESGTGPEQLATLRRRIRPLMLRRTKEQVAPELPPKIEQVLQVTLNPAHRRVYDKHLQRERQRVLGLLGDLQRNRIAIFRSLTLLRQLSLDASLVDKEHAGKVRSSKIDVLMDQLVEIVAEGHRVLVFSQFTGFLSLVRARLAEDGIDHCYLDGRTRDRPRRIAEFREGDAPVFLISLKAGGVGLTLTEADYVFVLDPWWNPATETQAIDRAHRIGQDKTVVVSRLVATDTIEEKVVALQQRKRDLFDRVVGDSAGAGAALSADDIRGLFE